MSDNMTAKIFFCMVIAVVTIVGFFLKPFIVVQDSAPQLFPLTDKTAQYKIRKEESGAYKLEHSASNGFRTSAYIGSSKIPLDSYVDQTVQFSGKFRQTLGTPLCSYKCTFSNKWIVIDIDDVLVIPDIESS